MLKKIRVLLLVCIATLLAACGGGGDSTGTAATADPVDAYVGVWKGCLTTDVNLWQIVEVTTSKTDATSGMTVLKGFASYKNAACTIVSNSQIDPAMPVKFTLKGSSTVQGKAAQKVEILVDGTATKWLWFRSGNQLFIGDFDAPTGADGYPTALVNEPLNKQ